MRVVRNDGGENFNRHLIKAGSQIVKSLEKIMTAVEMVFTAIAACCAALMMFLTSADAFSRYALNSPLLGAYEFTEKYLMVATIFLGLAYAYRGGAFIRVTFLVDRLSDRARLVADYFAYLVTLGFGVMIVYATARQSLSTLGDATTLNTLPIPTGPAYCIVPLGFLAMTLMLIADLPRIRTRQSALFATDTPAA